LIVVDTNVMVDRLVGGENGADAALLFESDPEWAAPTLLVSELRNVLLGYVRRGDLRADQAKAMYDDAAEILGGRITSVEGSQVIDIALECDLTAYDAEFVALARELGVALATSDKAILKGAADVAVSVRNARDLAEGR
jgi:predicted nucleic acid-binding protein